MKIMAIYLREILSSGCIFIFSFFVEEPIRERESASYNNTRKSILNFSIGSLGWQTTYRR